MERTEFFLRRIDAATYQQVQDLDVDCDGELVIVSGRSRTWYVKQLATQAVLAAAPQARVANEVEVVFD